jgi:hypothetical protein
MTPMTRSLFASRLGTLAAAALTLGLAASPASALNAVCEVLPTSDGFAALRSAPSTEAPMIRRMPTGHGVHMRSVQMGRLVTSGRWVQVTHWPDGKFYEPGDAEFSLGRTGWVVHRLVGECG